MTKAIRPVTGAEAARRLGVGREVIGRWLNQGKIRGFRTPGGRIRIMPAEIERIQKGRP